MPTSHEWLLYFQANARALMPIPWERGAELSAAEKCAIAGSLQEFQAGESSEGHHLFRYAKAYAERSGDHDYVSAVRLFIAEEQRHGRDLGRFLQLNDIALVKTTFTDRVFRKLRNVLHGLEVSVAVLVTAEIIAQVYYAVLREATASTILRRLCDQILRDELRHVQFQTGQLANLRARRSSLGLAATMSMQRFLFFGTVLVVWLFHHKVIRRGGMGLRDWWRSCWQHFNAGFAPQSTLDLGLTSTSAEPKAAATDQQA